MTAIDLESVTGDGSIAHHSFGGSMVGSWMGGLANFLTVLERDIRCFRK